ncbi:aldose 1-epimerase [Mariniphaga anaerophila]|uniref:Aldose 1-epimerase n=1 Tax=Mariniphaga anaerophila TaxID=1484053 RepID=A0A1M4XV75_9BACT|nr:aldose epimerase family protein [Mariniphaga anaerophila]SHE97330.1 aldose 1-epimerase [Mariniphaga anaerophila]
MSVQEIKFGTLPDGRDVQLFTLKNKNGLEVDITNYGGVITRIFAPDKNGQKENIVCGFDKLENYLSDEYLAGYPYFGAIIGRFGNRIANGKLEIEGKSYDLAVNNGPNHLHGGITGFDRRLWKATPYQAEGVSGVEFYYVSPHMEENYPGNLEVRCIFSLTETNELVLEYIAETDQATVVNLTNHTYFNLTGGKENILNHELKLSTGEMTEMIDQIPTGKILKTEGTPFDFSEFKTFAKDLAQLPTGYDDNFVLNNETGELKYTGTLREKSSGRQVEIFTSQPGMQLYTGYWIPEFTVDGAKKFGSYSGVALETQHYPDSVHHPEFPTTLLKPGEKYNQKTVYKFSLI